ncbi:MAG: efflux RND transporter periplasmic adaptor subunit [Pseudomonadota bacterium]
MIPSPLKLALAAWLLLPGCGLLPAGHDHAGHEQEAHVHDHEGDDQEAAPHQHADHAGQEDHDHDHAGHDHAGDEHAGHDHAGHVVALSAAAAANIGVKTEQVAPRAWYDQLKIPGVVGMDPDAQVTVATATAVRVISLDAPPHATVAAGQRLAVLELVDPDLRHLQIRATETRAALLEASTEQARTARYLEALRAADAEVAEERARVEADLEVLEARVAAQRSTLDTILAALETAGLSAGQRASLAEHGTPATRIEVHAPALSGRPDLEITAREVHVGQIVPAGSALFELCALDRLLVTGEAFEADLAAVRQATRDDLPVTVLFPAEGRVVEGLRIRSVEGTADGQERTTHFFVPMPNRAISEKQHDGARFVDWEERAGVRVQVLVATAPVGERVVIPATALVEEGGATYVYRDDGEDYERVEVRVERQEGRVAVLPADGPLALGDEIVVAGALQVHVACKQAEGGGGEAAGHHHNH